MTHLSDNLPIGRVFGRRDKRRFGKCMGQSIMKRWPGFKAWIWVMGTIFFVAGAAHGGGLQTVQGEDKESLSMSRLLGTSSGLQFLMDWGFFEVLESLHDESGSGFW